MGTTTTASFSYDANGNLISDGTNTYVYDVENRLVTASQGGTLLATLTYDPLGRLWEIDGGSAGKTMMLHDGPNLVAEYDPTSGNLLRRYVHGPGVEDPIVWYEGSGTTDRRFLMADERGSVTAATDARGAVIATNVYGE